MNLKQTLRLLNSTLVIPQGAQLENVDAAAYESATPFRRAILLGGAGVEDETFMEKLNAALGLTVQAPGTDPAARQRFDEAAGQSQIAVAPAQVFQKATRWVAPNLGGLPLLVMKGAAQGSPRVANSGLQMALGMYPSVYQAGGSVAFGVSGVNLPILGATLRSQIVDGVVSLWKQTGIDKILDDAARYQRHQQVSEAVTNAQANTAAFRSPQEIYGDCLQAAQMISQTVAGKFNEGLAAQLGQEFDLLLLPAIEDANFVTYGLGVPVVSGNALQTLLDHSDYQIIRWSKLLGDAMAEAVEALFSPATDLKEYVLKLGAAGIKYSTALNRFLLANGKSLQVNQEELLTLSKAEPMLQAVNQQQLVNTGNIVAGAGGVAAQNISGSQIVTGHGNNVSNSQYTAFDQRGSTNYGQITNTQGGLNIGGSVQAGGNVVGRDLVNYGTNVGGDQVAGDKVGGDQIFANVGEGSFGVAIGTDIEQIIADPAGYAQRVAQQAQAQAQRAIERAQRQKEREQRQRERAQRRGW